MTVDDARAPRSRRLDVAFRLFVGAAAVNVLVVLIGLTHIGAAVSSAKAAPGTDQSTVGVYVGVGIAIVLGFELGEAALFVVFARLARRGVPWARIGLLVLSVLTLLAVTEGGYVLGVLRLLLAAAGSVLLFTSPGRRAFRH